MIIVSTNAILKQFESAVIRAITKETNIKKMNHASAAHVSVNIPDYPSLYTQEAQWKDDGAVTLQGNNDKKEVWQEKLKR